MDAGFLPGSLRRLRTRTRGAAAGPFAVALPIFLGVALATGGTAHAGGPFIRGDSNLDGAVDIADATFTLAFLFVPGAPPALCLDAVDSNDDGATNIADAIATLGYLFTQGSPPPAPFPDCGSDPTADSLDCVGPVAVCLTGPASGPLLTGRSYAVPGGTEKLIGSDLDGDGQLDLVCLGTDDGVISVLRGLGGGAFAPPSETPVGILPVDMALAPLDGDAVPDLAVEHLFGSTGLVLLTGNPDGSFQPMQTIATFSQVHIPIAVGDVDSDGDLDIVGRNVYLGTGTGTFQSIPMTWPFGQVRDIELADLDLDGNVDIAVTSETPGGNLVHVYDGTGTGFFPGVPSTSYPTGLGPLDVDVLDVDQDGLIDLVTADSGSSTISILGGDPAAGFLPPLSFPIPGGPISEVILAHVNGDALIDAVVPTGEELAILAGTSSPIFAPPVLYGASGGSPVIADLDGDGFPDYVLAAGGRVDVHLGRAAGGAILAPLGTSIPTNLCLAVADLDGDGDLDAVCGGPTGLVTALGNGDGTFVCCPSAAVLANVHAVATGAVNADAYPDIVAVTADDQLAVYLGNAQGTLGASFLVATGNLPRGLRLADLDGDGDLDAAVACQFSNAVAVHLGNGAGAFAAPTLHPVGSSPWEVEVADVDGDADPDLLAATQGSSLVGVLLGNGAGGFAAAPALAMPGAPLRVRAGDLDGDGSTDVVSASALAGGLAIRLGTGGGGFAPAVALPTVGLPISLALADIDADGDLDILVGGQDGRVLALHPGDGAGAFGPAETYGFAIQPAGIVPVDIDGDGDLDVVGSGSNLLQSILNRTIGP